MLGKGATVRAFQESTRYENGGEERERSAYGKEGDATSPYHQKKRESPSGRRKRPEAM
jgi:hypothetical protein